MKNYKDAYLLDELKNYELRIANFKFKICLSREQNLNMIPEIDKNIFCSATLINVWKNNLTMKQ